MLEGARERNEQARTHLCLLFSITSASWRVLFSCPHTHTPQMRLRSHDVLYRVPCSTCGVLWGCDPHHRLTAACGGSHAGVAAAAKPQWRVPQTRQKGPAGLVSSKRRNSCHLMPS